MSADTTLQDGFLRFLAEISPLSAVRAAEAAGDASVLWQPIQASGFADALLPDNEGIAALELSHVVPLLIACGTHLLPAPLGETMVARKLLASAGMMVPHDLPILLWPETPDGRIRSAYPPPAIGAGFALCQNGRAVRLVPLADQVAEPDGFGVRPAGIDPRARPVHMFELQTDMLFRWSAALNSAAMAGAMARVLAMTIEHANSRMQFGKPLGKFQAVQQQISVMAEQVVMANVAARLAFDGAGTMPVEWRLAAARSVSGDAASNACAIAHAVHGAIGISAEHDLQLFVRRLKRWQSSFGSRDYWAPRVAAARLASDKKTAVDFILSDCRAFE